MIITKAPFRMSFFGGGTDYQPFFKEHGGSVISSTFDKYVYVTVRHLPRFFEYSTLLTYSKIEKVTDIQQLEHPLVRETMQYLDMHELHIGYDADLPARSGLGTSSSFACALLQSFHALKGHYVSVHQLAEEAIHVERNLCRENGGWQDQIAAAYGGLNRIYFSGDTFRVSPIIIQHERKKKLNSNLMLFFTGFVRFSSEIAESQSNATKRKEADILEMLSLVDNAEEILVNKHGDIDDFGRLLHHTWQLKRGITNKVSTSDLDAIYETALQSGALGGKLLGAGGGGFFLFYVPEEYQEQVKSKLSDLLYVPFEFEEEGTQVLYYKPEIFTLE